MPNPQAIIRQLSPLCLELAKTHSIDTRKRVAEVLKKINDEMKD